MEFWGGMGPETTEFWGRFVGVLGALFLFILYSR